MPHVSHISRGGQIWAHKIRMLRQILQIATRISLFLSCTYFAYRSYTLISLQGIMFWWVSWFAELKLCIGQLLNVKDVTITFYEGNQWITWPAKSFLQSFVLKSILFETQNGFQHLLSLQTLVHLGMICCLSYICVFLYFYFQGKRLSKSHHQKGLSLVSVERLKKEMKKKNVLGKLHLDGVPLVKGAETSHMLIAGTTGSGKTNTLRHLLPQIREQKAIIVDVTGEMTDQYFDKKKDILLSAESDHVWDLWKDGTDLFSYRSMAESFVGPGSLHEPFWTEAAKGCLAATLHKMSSTPSIKKLLKTLIRSPLSEFSDYLKGTSAAVYSDEKGERTTVSIRSTLISKIQSLEAMEHKTGNFSLKSWINQDPPGWLFLTTLPTQRDIWCPLITAQLAVLSQGLMVRKKTKTPVWFIIDELPALNKVSSLLTLLSEGRKYGACVVAGVQDISQLEVRYGTRETRTLLNQMNTKVLFRFTDPHGSHFVSQMLGEKEETQIKENLSYGANTIRDGVSMNEVTHKGPLIMPTEIAALNNLECYIKLPENLPVVKHHMTWVVDKSKDGDKSKNEGKSKDKCKSKYEGKSKDGSSGKDEGKGKNETTNNS